MSQQLNQSEPQRCTKCLKEPTRPSNKSNICMINDLLSDITDNGLCVSCLYVKKN